MQLRDFIRCYDNALNADFCDHLVSIFEQNESLQIQNGRNARSGLEHSGWYEMNIGRYCAPEIKQQLGDLAGRFKLTYEQDCNIEPLPHAGRYSELIIKRYRPSCEEMFQQHFDSLGPVSDRFLVFLWYLNDVGSGGETVFDDLNVSIKPAKGSLLMFPPYWQYRHRGAPPISNSKYIMSTYALW